MITGTWQNKSSTDSIFLYATSVRSTVQKRKDVWLAVNLFADRLRKLSRGDISAGGNQSYLGGAE